MKTKKTGRSMYNKTQTNKISTIAKIKKIVTDLLYSDKDKGFDLLSLCYRCIQPFLGDRTVFNPKKVKIEFRSNEAIANGVSVGVYDDITQTIYMANPIVFFKTYFFLHLFTTLNKKIYVEMFIIVFVHELVHAVQHQNEKCKRVSSCEKEAHACFVAKKFAAKFGMRDTYRKGFEILSWSHSIRNTFSATHSEKYEYFKQCYDKMSEDDKYKKWNCKT